MESKNVDSVKFHRLLSPSSANMISTNVIFCLILLSWDFVHSGEVHSQRDQIGQRFSFLNQLDSLLKSYKYDDNIVNDLSTSPAIMNLVKSDNLLAAETMGNNRPNVPHYNGAHPNNWWLDNTHYEDASKTYHYGHNNYNGGDSYNMYDNYGLLRKHNSLHRGPLVFSNHLPWRPLLLRKDGLLGYGEDHVSYKFYKHPLVEDINSLLYVTEMGCEFLATLSRNDPGKLSAYTPELRSWLRFMKTSGNLVISSPTRNIERLSCGQAWIRTWEFGVIRFKYRKNGYRYIEGNHDDPFRFVFKQPPAATVMKDKFDNDDSSDTISRSTGEDNDENTKSHYIDSMNLPVSHVRNYSKRNLSIQKKTLPMTTVTNRRKRVWGFYHRRLLSNALQSMRKEGINDRGIRMRVDLG